MITIACPKCGQPVSFKPEDIKSQYMNGITWKQEIEIYCDTCKAKLHGEWLWRLDDEEIKWTEA